MKQLAFLATVLSRARSPVMVATEIADKLLVQLQKDRQTNKQHAVVAVNRIRTPVAR